MERDSEVYHRADRLTDHISLGVLSGLIHRDVVDDVLRETGTLARRSRLLPPHVVVYYVLALSLFFGQSYEEVMRQLVNGLRFLGMGGIPGRCRQPQRFPRPGPGWARRR